MDWTAIFLYPVKNTVNVDCVKTTIRLSVLAIMVGKMQERNPHNKF